MTLDEMKSFAKRYVVPYINYMFWNFGTSISCIVDAFASPWADSYGDVPIETLKTKNFIRWFADGLFREHVRYDSRGTNPRQRAKVLGFIFGVILVLWYNSCQG